LTPNGALVLALTDAIAASISGMVMVTEPRMPKPPAALVAAVRRAPETQPMPVWMIG
jgi:hypothetical protein